ncbi:MAG: transglycosylase domain-containing protein [Clostridia bacterium]|nr:transglycosylase domain-containing protein [Clostridia bacterium]
MKKQKRQGKIPTRSVLKGVLNTFLTILLIGMITGTIVGMALLIYIKDYINTDYDIENLKLDLDQTTSIYYMDYTDEERTVGNWVEWEEERIHGSENRLWVSYKNIPENLINAFVAIEDQRFWDHKGVDWRRTAGAVLQVVKTGSFGYGGSTITQQLIKNVTGDKDVKIQRKLEEIFRALSLEKKKSKEDILEMYLNTIYLSQGCSGVQSAANFYFHKDVSDLTLAECACIASITNRPTYYDPIQNPDNNKYRRDVILDQMLEQKYISQSEHDAAVAEELVFFTAEDVEEEESDNTYVHSWFVETLIADVISDLMEEKGLDESTATQMVYSGGLKIYSTVDVGVQRAMEEVFENEENYPELQGVQPQAAMIVINPYNSNVLGVIGARGEKTTNGGWNNVTMSQRQPGSSFKPIAVYSQAIENGIATYSTIVDDYPYNVNPATGKAWPSNSPNTYKGYTSVCDAIIRSVNTVAVRLLDKIGIENSFYFLRDKFRISTIVERVGTKGDMGLSMALGGLTYGVNMRDIATAYGTFANSGIYTPSRTYIKVCDSQGNIILSNEEKGEVILSQSTAQVMTKMLSEVADPTGYGTARRLTVTKNVEVAAKTGTTNDNKDIYFVGYTPYFLGAVWFGYEQPRYLPNLVPSPSLTLWDMVMLKIHEQYVEDDKNGITDLKKFDYSDLVSYRYCRDSGLLPGEYCSLDPRGSRISTGYGTKDSIPTATCDKHVPVQWCTETGAVAGSGCPSNKVVTIALVKNEERRLERNAPVTDAQYTYMDVPADYIYPTETDVPFYINLYINGTYPGYTADVKRPINSWCVEHNGENTESWEALCLKYHEEHPEEFEDEESEEETENE